MPIQRKCQTRNRLRNACENSLRLGILTATSWNHRNYNIFSKWKKEKKTLFLFRFLEEKNVINWFLIGLEAEKRHRIVQEKWPKNRFFSEFDVWQQSALALALVDCVEEIERAIYRRHEWVSNAKVMTFRNLGVRLENKNEEEKKYIKYLCCWLSQLVGQQPVGQPTSWCCRDDLIVVMHRIRFRFHFRCGKSFEYRAFEMTHRMTCNNWAWKSDRLANGIIAECWSRHLPRRFSGKLPKMPKSPFESNQFRGDAVTAPSLSNLTQPLGHNRRMLQTVLERSVSQAVSLNSNSAEIISY